MRLTPIPLTAFLKTTFAALVLLSAGSAFASIFGSVRGIIHDPQHRPVDKAMVMIKAKTSDWSTTTTTDPNGEFNFNAVPLGEYSVSVAASGFEQIQQNVVVISGSQPVLHFALNLLGAKETVNVFDVAESAPTDSATPVTLVSRLDIARTPGADRTNSLAMITDYVPGSYVTHDMLHIRGGHQTSLAARWRPHHQHQHRAQCRPAIRSQRYRLSRSQSRQLWRRVRRPHLRRVQRSAAHRLRAQSTKPNWCSAPAISTRPTTQFSFGSHTERFAYYASVNGNRSDLGLQTPVPQVVHDAVNGFGGFGSFIFNADPSNQLRLVTSCARTIYQIPYDPFPSDIETDHRGQRIQPAVPEYRPARRRARSRCAGEFSSLGAHLQFAAR